MSFSAKLVVPALTTLVLPAQTKSALDSEPNGWSDNTARGATLFSCVNGETVSEYKYCPVLTGHIGLEAECFRIESRNLTVKSFAAAPLQ